MQCRQRLYTICVAILLTTRTNGGNYTVTGQSTTFDVCLPSTSTETCIIEVDGDCKLSTINCNNAATCIIRCGLASSSKAFESATINAQNSSLLIMQSTVDQCFRFATINLPHSGSANLYAHPGTKTYIETAINAGPNTQNVYIECNGGGWDDCRNMEVHAETAQYLEILVGANTELDSDGVSGGIYCPQNSNYAGPEIAPCIIDVDVAGGAEVISVNFYTLYGVPQDLWFKGSGNAFRGSDSFLTCSARRDTLIKDGGTTLPLTASELPNCWNTESPTSDPTQSTSSPTRNPSRNPTVDPSRDPSESPTGSPSRTPSVSPSQNPSTSPSAAPTKSPQQFLEIQPTPKPTRAEDAADDTPTFSPTLPTYKGTEATVEEDDLMADTSQGFSWIFAVLLAVTALFSCVFGACIYKRCRSKDESKKNVQSVVDSIRGQESSNFPTAVERIESPPSAKKQHASTLQSTPGMAMVILNQANATPQFPVASPMSGPEQTENRNADIDEGESGNIQKSHQEEGVHIDMKDEDSEHSQSDDLYIARGAVSETTTTGNGGATTTGYLLDETEQGSMNGSDKDKEIMKVTKKGKEEQGKSDEAMHVEMHVVNTNGNNNDKTPT